MKEINFLRFDKLIDFVETNSQNSFYLQRKEIAEIVGVKEGDSLKNIFKILLNHNEIYSKKFNYEKQGKKHYFEKVNITENNNDNKIDKPIMNNIFRKENKEVINNITRKNIVDKSIIKKNNQLKSMISKNLKMLQIIKNKDEIEFDFLIDHFKNEMDFINIFKKANAEKIVVSNKEKYIDSMNKKIENLEFMYNSMRLYDIMYIN